MFFIPRKLYPMEQSSNGSKYHHYKSFMLKKVYVIAAYVGSYNIRRGDIARVSMCLPQQSRLNPMAIYLRLCIINQACSDAIAIDITGLEYRLRI